MKSRFFVVAALILASTAAGAFANRFSATLAQPLSKKKQVIVGYNVWRCEGTSCALASAPTDVNSVRTCRELRHEVGELTAYGSEGKMLDTAALAACNAP